MKDMLGRQAAMEPDRALEIILGSTDLKEPESTEIKSDDAAGRVAAEDVHSPEDIPGFTRSTMDGYAVRAADTFGATETSPAYLDIQGEILMGQEATEPLIPGKAMKIATGGMLPEGADAVLMFEYASLVEGRMLEAQRSVPPGENLIRKGEDLAKGELALSKGTLLRPQHIGALASMGITALRVYELPTVAVISTGDEVVPPGSKPGPGVIRDSNSYLLSALIGQSGAIPVRRGIIRDDYDEIRRCVELSAKQNDLVLITGGSSVGTRDMTERVITDTGELLLHSVKLKPGKPFMAGTVSGTPIFGLPGHPRAVAVCFDSFVQPLVRKLSGLKSAEPSRTIEARLSKSVHSPSGRREYIDVTLIEDTDGTLLAEPVQGKSGLLRTMLNCQGSICVPLNKLGFEAGDIVKVILY